MEIPELPDYIAETYSKQWSDTIPSQFENSENWKFYDIVLPLLDTIISSDITMQYTLRGQSQKNYLPMWSVWVSNTLGRTSHVDWTGGVPAVAVENEINVTKYSVSRLAGIYEQYKDGLGGWRDPKLRLWMALSDYPPEATTDFTLTYMYKRSAEWYAVLEHQWQEFWKNLFPGSV